MFFFRHSLLSFNEKSALSQIKPQVFRGGHGLQNQMLFRVSQPCCRTDDFPDVFTAHAGNHHIVRLMRKNLRQAVGEARMNKALRMVASDIALGGPQRSQRNICCNSV